MQFDQAKQEDLADQLVGYWPVRNDDGLSRKCCGKGKKPHIDSSVLQPRYDLSYEGAHLEASACDAAS